MPLMLFILHGSTKIMCCLSYLSRQNKCVFQSWNILWLTKQVSLLRIHLPSLYMCNYMSIYLSHNYMSIYLSHTSRWGTLIKQYYKIFMYLYMNKSLMGFLNFSSHNKQIFLGEWGPIIPTELFMSGISIALTILCTSLYTVFFTR